MYDRIMDQANKAALWCIGAICFILLCCCGIISSSIRRSHTNRLNQIRNGHVPPSLPGCPPSYNQVMMNLGLYPINPPPPPTYEEVSIYNSAGAVPGSRLQQITNVPETLQTETLQTETLQTETLQTETLQTETLQR